jgi:hypothetical protein
MTRRILVMLGVALLITARAEAIAWGTQTTIAGYYVYETGSAWITTPSNQNPDGCASSVYLYINVTAEHFHEIWATVMAAQAAGSTVTLHYAGCFGNYPKIDAVAVPHVW